jgi:uncharacterized protein YjbI with pentapeptide repeats
MSEPVESEVKVAPARGPARLLPTLVVGLLLGASLGPALFLAVRRLEQSGDALFSFAVGAFLALVTCLIVISAATLVILPRIFADARGTLVGIIADLTSASQAHAEGDTLKAIDHLGRAASEGASWYSIGTTRRFIAQAALGLLISFGGTIGAVLLLSQNSLLRDQNMLLRDQNAKIDRQVDLLADQNTKIDKQLELLTSQNSKIDQQTSVADAQKRGAFVTEMFSILQEVAKTVGPDGKVSKDLAARIAVLSASAVPYVYLDFSASDAGYNPKRIARPLSPERGQLVVALARMGVRFWPLQGAGAVFDSSDLRGVSLVNANMSGINLRDSDLSSSNLTASSFVWANLSGATIKNVAARDVDFNNASITDSLIENSDFGSTTFKGALVRNVNIRGGSFARSNFIDCFFELEVSFENVNVQTGLPSGLDWPDEVRTRFEGGERRLNHKFEFPFSGARIGMPIPDDVNR